MAEADVLLISEAMDHLKGLRSAADETQVAGLLTTVSKWLDEQCGPIVKRVVTEVHRNVSGPIFLEGKPYAGTGATVPVITEAWSNETPVALVAADYLLEDDGCSGRLTRWAGYWGARVSVTYSAGRFQTTALVEEPFKSAAGELLRQWWRPSNGGGSETYGAVLAAFGGEALDEVRKMLVGELLPPVSA